MLDIIPVTIDWISCLKMPICFSARYKFACAAGSIINYIYVIESAGQARYKCELDSIVWSEKISNFIDHVIVFKLLRFQCVNTCPNSLRFQKFPLYRAFSKVYGYGLCFDWILVDAVNVPATKCLRMPTNPDTCGRGITLTKFYVLFLCWNMVTFTVGVRIISVLKV